MLTLLGVRDFAIVDNLELALRDGMTVLTGETGAGKSLLVDALELAVGERASADAVRAGAQSAEVNAVFEPGDEARAWLRAAALEDADGICVLRRVVAADGRSRAFVNGRPVTVTQLKALGDLLVDVHGQHAHQSLLRADTPRALLDEHADLAAPLAQIRKLHARLRALDDRITSLRDAAGASPDRLDFLRYQIGELEALALAPGEAEALALEHRRLAHAAEVLERVARARAALDDDDAGAGRALAAARRELDSAARLDDRVGDALALLADAANLLADVDASLRHHADAVEVDGARLAEIEQRIDAVHELARKHRCRPEELPGRLAALRDEAARIEGSDESLRRLHSERDAALASYREIAGQLSEGRREAATKLASEVGAVLASLGMDGARVEFEVVRDVDAPPGPNGQDRVHLNVATNPGQAPLALARVASGGELSRIALAVHTVALAREVAGTVVFDEVDAGIGGRTAEVVGRRMRALGEHRQVLTVTHLPQVAALAHHHVAVRKRSDDGVARTTLAALDDGSRIEEIARMLGGVEVTDKTREHAREMVAAAARRRRPAA